MIRRTKEKLVLQYDSTVSFFADAVRRMQAHEGFKRYFKNTGWLFLGRMFGLATSFFTGVYVARYLGPGSYGFLSYIISFAGLFSFLANLGVDGILSRELVKYPNKKDELLGTGFYIKILGSILAVCATFVASFFANSDRFTSLLVILFSVSFFPQAFGVIDAYFQSQVLSKNIVKVQAASTIISVVVKIVCIVLDLDVVWFLAAYVLDSVILALGLVMLFRENGYSILSWHFNRALCRKILTDSFPLMLSSAALLIYMRIDQVMIKNMLGNEASGLYAVAVKLAETWYFIPGIICASFFPAIINAKQADQQLYDRRMSMLYSLMFFLSLFMALIISSFSYNIVSALYGYDYLGAVPALQIYVWSGIWVALGMVVGQFLIAENYAKISFWLNFFGAIVNVLLNIVLIPRFGISGAAMATSISYFFVVFAILFFKKTRHQAGLIVRSLLLIRSS